MAHPLPVGLGLRGSVGARAVTKKDCQLQISLVRDLWSNPRSATTKPWTRKLASNGWLGVIWGPPTPVRPHVPTHPPVTKRHKNRDGSYETRIKPTHFPPPERFDTGFVPKTTDFPYETRTKPFPPGKTARFDTGIVTRRRKARDHEGRKQPRRRRGGGQVLSCGGLSCRLEGIVW